MGNNSINPLKSPQQLWGNRPAPAPVTPQQPAPVNPQQPVPATPGTLPGALPPSSPGTVMPTYTPPADTLPTLPGQGTSVPQVPFTQPAQPSAAQSLGQLNQLFQTGDDGLLSKYGVSLSKNMQGQITGIFVQNQSVTPEQLKNYLLPVSGELHQQIVTLKNEVDTSYNAVYQKIQQNFGTMTQPEQQAIQLQMNAVHTLYQNFVQRLQQIDGLIQ